MSQTSVVVTPTPKQATPDPQTSVRAPSIRWSSMRRREAIAGYLFILPFLIFFGIFVARAIVTGVFMSFFDWPILPPVHTFRGLGNYNELFNDSLWWLSLKNTLIFAVTTVGGSTLLALGSAMAIHHLMRGKSFFRALLYAPAVLSVGVVGIAWGWLMDGEFGTINYVLHLLGIPKIAFLGDASIVLSSISLVTIWWTFGFPMLVFLAGIQNIPEQLYEAAYIDGANGRQAFRFITLPLLRPTILFVMVTSVISHFQVFGQSYILTGGGPGHASYTVIIYLYNFALRNYRLGYGSAIAVSLAVVLIAITFVQFRVLGRRERD